MSFNSSIFIVFFVLVMAFYYSPAGWKTKKAGMLLASYLFYAAWNPPFVLLLLVSTVADWFIAARLGRDNSARNRKLLLLATLAVNLGLLGFFKYGSFALENFSALASVLGVAFNPPHADIILPIGISFYTFQTLSYTLDVYAGRMKPWESFLDYALYVSFFPQLVAGPIVRAGQFLPQCREKPAVSFDRFAWGLTLFVFGLFMKQFMADYLLAPVAEQVFSVTAPSSIDTWVGTFSFSAQIFFDFSGYSTCAVGIALCMGFSIPGNFRFPYGATGFIDFWRRWHVSLSEWFRDYVYIPLGGGRKGEGRAIGNILFTMLVCGLWHGAAWNFVLWGAVHGLLIIAERMTRRIFKSPRKSTNIVSSFVASLATFIVVSTVWVFFRTDSAGSAFNMLSIMFSFQAGASLFADSVFLRTIIICIALFAVHFLLRNTNTESVVSKIPWWGVSIAVAVMTILIILSPGDDRAFIYFQF